ncbi:MAG TPA: TIGR04086 family membrane protein [Ruminococcaceae bacterium]|jgi:putative membrane protein (TIGR04086 family)|nr:TIGR04086 family membrane protein [Oscillospiraceae bacterium]HBG54659.1 TIGR04086 family membrane protein [Oscillospiraceae bacterium]
MARKGRGRFSVKSSNAASGQRTLLTAVKAIVVGSVSGAALCAVVLALCALAFVSSSNLPHGFLSPFILAVSVLSAGFSGFVTARISRRRGLVYGAVAGLFLYLLFLVSGMGLSQNGTISQEAEVRLLVMVLSGGIGGFLAVNGKGRRK